MVENSRPWLDESQCVLDVVEETDIEPGQWGRLMWRIAVTAYLQFEIQNPNGFYYPWKERASPETQRDILRGEGGGGKREGIRSQTTQTYLLTTEITLFNSFEHSSITETNEDSQINNWLIILQQSTFEIINTRRFKLIQDILVPTVFRELPSYFLIKHSALGEPLHNSQVLKNERLPKKMEAAIMARE